MAADPLPSLLAAGFTPEEARKACNVIADAIEDDYDGIVSESLRSVKTISLDVILSRLRAAGGGQ